MDINPDVHFDIDWSSWSRSIDGGSMVALENALRNAYRACTGQEFGAALKDVMRATGRTQGEILRHDSRTEKKWLSKSTVSRLVNGVTIGRHREQVEAFIRACGSVEAYVELWGVAWTNLRAALQADKDAATAATEGVARVDTESTNALPKSYQQGKEPELRRPSDPILETFDARPSPGAQAFIIVCGMGSRVVFIRWYGRSVEEARITFREWLKQPWQTLATDFSGVAVPNGLDFKPGRIEWFNIAS